MPWQVIEKGCFMSQMNQWVMSHESWVMSQWVNESMRQIYKNNIFGRNNKIKHYFYYFVYLLHCCLHVQGLFLTWNLSLGCLLAVFQALPLLLYACMARRIAFPDTLKNHLKHQIRQSISLLILLVDVPYQNWSAAPRLFILVGARVLNRRANVNKHKHNANNECPKILINQRALKAI